jgi:hypothetical protein
MAELPPPGAEEGTASREEVCSAISALSAVQLNRIHEYAKWRAKALSVMDCAMSQEDLLQEALKRTLSRERRWDRKIRFDIHLIGVIRSIDSHARERASVAQVLQYPVAWNEGDAAPVQTIPSSEVNPERVAGARQFIAKLRGAFEC